MRMNVVNFGVISLVLWEDLQH